MKALVVCLLFAAGEEEDDVAMVQVSAQVTSDCTTEYTNRVSKEQHWIKNLIGGLSFCARCWNEGGEDPLRVRCHKCSKFCGTKPIRSWGRKLPVWEVPKSDCETEFSNHIASKNGILSHFCHRCWWEGGSDALRNRCYHCKYYCGQVRYLPEHWTPNKWVPSKECKDEMVDGNDPKQCSEEWACGNKWWAENVCRKTCKQCSFAGRVKQDYGSRGLTCISIGEDDSVRGVDCWKADYNNLPVFTYNLHTGHISNDGKCLTPRTERLPVPDINQIGVWPGVGLYMRPCDRYAVGWKIDDDGVVTMEPGNDYSPSPLYVSCNQGKECTLDAGSGRGWDLCTSDPCLRKDGNLPFAF